VCRLLGYCSRSQASLAELIGEEGLRDFTALSALHSDGWGMAWYGDGEPVIRKSLGRADNEPEYDELAHKLLGELGLLHLRWATPGLPVKEVNTHPFRYGSWVLAHNGAIHPQSRLPQLLPPPWEARAGGTTDSERYFLQLMWRLEERGGDVAAAVADTVADIDARFEPNSLNAILLSPGQLAAISWHDPAKVPGEQLRKRGFGDRPEEVAAYFHLAYRATDEAVVVASSGWSMPGWTPLPRGHLLVTDRATFQTSVVPIGAPEAAVAEVRALAGTGVTNPLGREAECENRTGWLKIAG